MRSLFYIFPTNAERHIFGCHSSRDAPDTYWASYGMLLNILEWLGQPRILLLSKCLPFYTTPISQCWIRTFSSCSPLNEKFSITSKTNKQKKTCFTLVHSLLFYVFFKKKKHFHFVQRIFSIIICLPMPCIHSVCEFTGSTFSCIVKPCIPYIFQGNLYYLT